MHSSTLQAVHQASIGKPMSQTENKAQIHSPHSERPRVTFALKAGNKGIRHGLEKVNYSPNEYKVTFIFSIDSKRLSSLFIEPFVSQHFTSHSRPVYDKCVLFSDLPQQVMPN